MLSALDRVGIEKVYFLRSSPNFAYIYQQMAFFWVLLVLNRVFYKLRPFEFDICSFLKANMENFEIRNKKFYFRNLY